MNKADVLASGSFANAGVVGIEDYTTWADHFGSTYPMSVPEPATMALLAFGGMAMLRRRK